MSRRPRPQRKGRKAGQKQRSKRTRRAVATDILILSNGTVLAHNLTLGMADVLHKLNPKDETIRARAGHKRKQPPGDASSAKAPPV
jgi:hypothetical protein